MAEDKKTIQLKVVNSAKEAVTFRVKTTTKFSKILAAYCQKNSLDASSVRLMFDGERCEPDATPLDLDMEDGDQIDVVVEAVGGCCKASSL